MDTKTIIDILSSGKLDRFYKSKEWMKVREKLIASVQAIEYKKEDNEK